MKRLMVLFVVVALGAGLLGSRLAFASDPLQNACADSSASPNISNSSICQSRGNGTDNPISGSNGILTKTISVVSFVAGIAAIIVMLIAGVSYVTSNGDSGKLNTAREMIIYSLVGLVIIVLARSIIIFIINRA